MATTYDDAIITYDSMVITYDDGAAVTPPAPGKRTLVRIIGRTIRRIES